jgi:hypothetical protein
VKLVKGNQREVLQIFDVLFNWPTVLLPIGIRKNTSLYARAKQHQKRMQAGIRNYGARDSWRMVLAMRWKIARVLNNSPFSGKAHI